MKIIYLLIAITCAVSQVSAQTAQSFVANDGVNANWGAASSWTQTAGPGDEDGIPDAMDTVVIGNNSIIKTSSSVSCAKLTLDCNVNGTLANAYLLIRGAAGEVNVSGDLELIDDLGANIIYFAWVEVKTANSKLNVDGDIIFDTQDAVGAKIRMSNNTGTVNLKGNFVFKTANGATIEGGTAGSVMNFEGSAAAQTIPSQHGTISFCNISNNNTHASGLTVADSLSTNTFTGSFANNEIFSDGGFDIGMAGQLTNVGTYNASGALDVDSNIVNSGTFTSTGCNINIAENWNNTGTYTYNAGDTVSFDGSLAQTIDGATNWSVLNINNSAGVTANTGAQNIYNILDIDQGTFTATSAVTLISDGTSTGQLDNVGTGGYSGSLTVQRNIVKSSQGYVLIGSPLSGNTMDNYHDGGIAAGQEFILTGYAGADWWTGGEWFNSYTYDETVTGTSDQGWTAVTSNGLAIGADGNYKAQYIYVDAATYNISMTGTPSTGTLNVALDYTNTGDASADGWNLINNPHPCTVDWQTIRTGITNLIDGYMVYSDDVGNYAWWDGDAAAGTGDATQYIPSMQGFWVQSTGDTQLSIAETDKNASQDVTFIKSSSADDILRMHLSGNVNQYRDEALIIARNHYSNNFESNDLIKFITPDSLESPTLFSYSNDGVGLAFNKVNTGMSLDIPLTAKAGTNAQGTYQLDFDIPENFMSGACISLEDLATGTTTDVKLDSSYSFTSTDTMQTPRFILHIGMGIESIVNDLNCYGDTDGKIVLTGNGITGSNFTIKDQFNADVFNGIATNDSVIVNNLPGGEYSVTTDFVSNCISSGLVLTVAEPSAVVSDFELEEDTIYLSEGQIMSLNNNSNGLNYAWDFGDGNSANSFNPTHEYAAPGIYQVILTVSNEGNCAVTTSHNIVVLAAPLSINDVEEDYFVNAFVANDRLLVQFDFDSKKDIVINLTDISGKVILNNIDKKVKNDKVELTRTDLLSKGIYFVTVIMDNEKFVKRISIN